MAAFPITYLLYCTYPLLEVGNRSEGLLLLHSFLSLDIFVAFSILRFWVFVTLFLRTMAAFLLRWSFTPKNRSFMHTVRQVLLQCVKTTAESLFGDVPDLNIDKALKILVDI